MALSTRPKPKAHDRKRQAKHHAHGKNYLKTYWPYLPMLTIIGVGVVVNRTLQSSALLGKSVSGSIFVGSRFSSQESTRIQNLLGNQSQSVFIVTLAVAAAAIIYFGFTYWLRISRLLSKGEAYIIKRPMLEISAVFIITCSIVLTRVVTVIH